MTELSEYRTLVFDCDGVVLNSNRVKTEAFKTAALPWGKAAAEALVVHHEANGGVSRYEKFAYFLEQILPEHTCGRVPGQDSPDLDTLLASYADTARAGLMSCQIADGLEELRAATPQTRWLIVSGGDQTELRQIFEQRGLASLFDGGIFGSPDTKFRILEREMNRRNIRFPALFLGDSRLDHQAATATGLDFVFVSEWTDFEEWEPYTNHHSIQTIKSIRSLLRHGRKHEKPKRTKSDEHCPDSP